MLNHGYLAQRLRRPLSTKDGGTLRTVGDAANYIVALPEDRRRTHWDRAAQLLLDLADASEISRQLELALFYDRQLNLKMRHAETSTYVRGSSRGDCQSLIPPTRRSNAALFMLLTWRSDLLGGSDVLVGELLPKAG